MPTASGTSAPKFTQAQPRVVINAPEANELGAMIANTQKSIAPWALFFSSGR